MKLIMTKGKISFVPRFLAAGTVCMALLVWLVASQSDNPADVWLYFGKLWLGAIAAGLLIGGVYGLIIRFTRRPTQR